MHVGEVMVFDPPGGRLDHERLMGLFAQRVAHLPRYRQKVRWVPGNLANPVWIDDETFDLSYHVRRAALPKPGGDAQLREFVARVQPRPLDRGRPLWEAYIVEGLEHGRFAIVTKDTTRSSTAPSRWTSVRCWSATRPGGRNAARPVAGPAQPERPQPADLGGGRLGQGPAGLAALGARRVSGAGGPRWTCGHRRRVAGVDRRARRGASRSHHPLNAHVGQARRFVMVGTDLAAYRAVAGSPRGRTPTT